MLTAFEKNLNRVLVNH